MFPDENSIKIISWLLGVVGSLLLCGGGLVTYIFKRHVKDNDCCQSKNRDDHNRMHERIDKVMEHKR